LQLSSTASAPFSFPHHPSSTSHTEHTTRCSQRHHKTPKRYHGTITLFNDSNHTFNHVAGRIVDPETGKAQPDEYVVGWAKRGPNGLIGNNKSDSVAIVESMLADRPTENLYFSHFQRIFVAYHVL
jgi:NADPH-dependent glutamate synthase beta subunit-like oxidoreductase